MDVICIGEALIDFFAVQPGFGLRDVTEFRKIAGSATANVAVGVAKLEYYWLSFMGELLGKFYG